MGQIFEAQLVGTELKIGIAVGRFNEFINDKLLSGAMDGLKRHSVDAENIDMHGFQLRLKCRLLKRKWRKRKIMMR